jgi:hypothetical protein
MNKIIDRYLFIIYILPIPLNFQVLSQNQSSHRFIISKKEQQAKFALLTLVKEELPAGEFEEDFNVDQLSRVEISSRAYFYQLEIRDSEKSLPDGKAGSGQTITRSKKLFLLNNIFSIFI